MTPQEIYVTEIDIDFPDDFDDDYFYDEGDDMDNEPEGTEPETAESPESEPVIADEYEPPTINPNPPEIQPDDEIDEDDEDDDGLDAWLFKE